MRRSPPSCAIKSEKTEQVTMTLAPETPIRAIRSHSAMRSENRRNSAYLIDAKVATLMCHKIGEDGTGNYDPCTGNPDPCNPITFSNEIGKQAQLCLLNRCEGRHPHVP